MNLRKRNDAVSSVFSIVLILMIFFTSMTSILFWGIPYIENEKAKNRSDAMASEFSALDEILQNLVIDGADAQRIETITNEEGSFDIDSNGDRLVLMYSFDEGYEFNVSNLALNDGDEHDITIEMSKGKIDQATFYWLEETCFLAGTKILMADGSYKNIEFIKSGDVVLSYDLDQNIFVESAVEQLLVYTENIMDDYYIVLNGNVRVTPNHFFYVNTKWVEAESIEIGDFLVDNELDHIKVFSIEKVYMKKVTYDLELEYFNTYFADTFLVKSDIKSWDDKIINNDIFSNFVNIFSNVFSSSFLVYDFKNIVEQETVSSAEEQFETLGFDLNTCFPAGTMITMADGSLKRIEDVEIGDKVLSYDISKKEFIAQVAIGIEEPIREGVYDINGGLVSPTCDHPLYVRKMDGTTGWAAVDPIYCMKVHPFIKNVLKLEVGDELFTVDNEWIKINSIEFRKGPIQVYTLDVRGVNNFFANGTLAHNTCCFMPGTPINMADGSYKNIEDVVVGDLVKVFNENTFEVEDASVTRISTKMHDDVCKLYLSNGKVLMPTANHPFFTKEKGWATIDGLDELGIGCSRLCIGDHVYQINSDGNLEEIKVVDIVSYPGEYLTYNFVDMKHGTFIADDIVTHNTVVDCFMPGTPINMADGTYKNIEDVRVGDLVKVFNENTFEVEDAPVTSLQKVWHDNVCDLYLSSGKVLRPTANHPFLVSGKGWCTISGLDELGMGAGRLCVGDYVFCVESDGSLNEVKVIDIVPVEGSYLTYNFLDMKYGTFIADDIVTHNSGGVVTCFPAGTKITMADNSLKNIEDIKVGEQILSFDVDSQSFIITTVTVLHHPVREGVYDINNGFIQPTCDHPFYVRKINGVVGWASINPEMTKIVYPSLASVIMKLEIGDEMYTIDSKWIIIDSIKNKPGMIQTYTFNVDGGGRDANNYFANGILTHNLCQIDVAPTVTTEAIQLSDVGETTFLGRGNIVSVGSGVCTKRGIYYGTSFPSTSAVDISVSFPTGIYSKSVSSLVRGTHYYYHAAAYNIYGWGYGSTSEFLTKPAQLSSFTATSNGGSQIDLSWAYGVGGDKVYIEYVSGLAAPMPWTVGSGTVVPGGSPAGVFAGTSKSHTGLSASTKYYYKAWPIAVDGVYSSDNSVAKPYGNPSIVSATTGSLNNPPIIGTLSGPTSLGATVPGTYSISATDFNGDQVQYWFDWDDGTDSGWTTPLVPSGTISSLDHNWITASTYIVKAKARDVHGLESVWSDGLTVTIAGNLQPNVPSLTSSYTVYYNDTDYSFTASTTDPDNDLISYNFSWGDGTYSGWISSPGSHSWSQAGIYEITVKAKDELGLESDWSEPLGIQVKYTFRPPDDRYDSEGFSSTSGDPTIMTIQNTRRPLKGTVRIDLFVSNYPSEPVSLGGHVPFGRIWIFDLGSLCHTYSASNGVYKTIFENNGILAITPTSRYLQESSNIYESGSNTIVCKVTQIRGKGSTSGSGTGTYKLKLHALNSFVGESQTSDVYYLKLQMSGDNKDIWYTYLTFPWTADFNAQSGYYADTLLYKNGISTKLACSSSLIRVNITDII